MANPKATVSPRGRLLAASARGGAAQLAGRGPSKERVGWLSDNVSRSLARGGGAADMYDSYTSTVGQYGT